MAFAITANFLLGTYQGSDSGGRPEPYPSPDRLYKACVAAAYNTFDFERQTDDRVLTDEQIKNALAWLEDNPPHSIQCMRSGKWYVTIRKLTVTMESRLLLRRPMRW